MNIGLLYTPVSIYQMTRGALVLFVGILSVLFLRRKLWLYQFRTPSFPPSIFSILFIQIILLFFFFRWASLITVMIGVSLVGFSGSLIKDTLKDSLASDLLYRFIDEEPIQKPEATMALIGILFNITLTPF